MSIVREHGGNILAETLPAGGAAFTVSLPAVARSAGTLKDLDTSSGEWIPPSMELLHNRSILVLDDEESIRMLLSEVRWLQCGRAVANCRWQQQAGNHFYVRRCVHG